MKKEEKLKRIQKKLDKKGISQKDLERQRVVNALHAKRDKQLQQINLSKKSKIAQDKWDKTVLETHHTRIRNKLKRKKVK